MPTYEYACKDCGEHLEVVQSFKDDPLTICPNCQGSLRKVFSAAGLIFKGSGWHIKDYKSTSAGATASSPSSAGADKATSDSGSSSTAPARQRLQHDVGGQLLHHVVQRQEVRLTGHPDGSSTVVEAVEAPGRPPASTWSSTGVEVGVPLAPCARNDAGHGPFALP
jgi:putative FmdB family regulatory protein